MRRKLILDVDTGTDDAVAVMLASLHPALDLVACTTVNGNAEVGYCTDNTLRVLDHVGRRDIPVYEGLSRPLVRADFPIPRTTEDRAGKFHGKTLPLPPSSRAKAEKGAVEFLIDTYRDASDDIVLVPVAPLSNIAAAVALDPHFAARVPEVVIMGGGHAIGNVTPSAEFNIWGDPEAAASVLSAGFRKITLVPLDATHRALVSSDDCARLRALETPAGEAAADSSSIGSSHTTNRNRWTLRTRRRCTTRSASAFWSTRRCSRPGGSTSRWRRPARSPLDAR